MAVIKRMSIEEFTKMGLLQEVNRLFFHPRGLALEVAVDENDNYSLSGIWDERDDPEGITYQNPPSQLKADYAYKLLLDKSDTRLARFGFIIQPVEKP